MRSLSSFLLLLPLSFTLHAQKWVGTWAAAPLDTPPHIRESVTLGQEEYTLRQVVHISQGGKKLRVTLTNEFGTSPLTIAATHVGFLSEGSTVLPNTDHAITFNGKASVTIEPGQFQTSDPIDLTLPIFSDLVISLDVPPQAVPVVTTHQVAVATTFFAQGNHTADEKITPLATTTSWYFLKNLQVDSEKHSAAIVTLGDSITDGTRSTVDANRRWPDVLASRLAANKKTKSLSILNEGISGNRILHANTGPRALSRLDRDVLTAPGARYVILLESINDIRHAVAPKSEADKVTAAELINAMKEIVMRAHSRNLKIFGATLTPAGGSTNFIEAGETMRQEINRWIRTPGNFDGMIDFDKVTADPEHPDRFLPKYDSGDHLHPNDTGYAAMGTAIDLKLFR